MNVSNLAEKNEFKKHIFKTKVEKDGLLLQVHHTVLVNKREQRIRFIHSSFDNDGNTLAASDHAGNVFLIDFLRNKFWLIPEISSCTVLKFSQYNHFEIIVGSYKGTLSIINVHTGELTGELDSHKHPVVEITFSSDNMCLTTSKSEAILWNLETNTKVQVLSIDSNCILKHVLFMPVTNNILACFHDDAVIIWKYGTFEIVKQIQPNLWNKNSLKSIAFTRNGRAIIFSGHSNQLTIYMLDTWTIGNTIILPDCIQSVKKIEFISQLFDGGSNKILAILAGNGILHFYNMAENLIVNNITTPLEIIRFECSDSGKHIACVLKSGEINVYKLSHYLIEKCQELSKVSSGTSKSVASSSIYKRSSTLVCIIQQQLKEVLDVDKLRSILKQFGQYPEAYRLKIWNQLLELPNNIKQYNVFINHHTQSSFENLSQEYPLENKLALKNLKKVLSNLVTWCPYFSQVTYLPIFVFPFVKIFQNKPILCFEAVCTIILNWCQYWFEYFPLPPLNILAMIENLLQEHDIELLQHLSHHKVTSKLYAWSIMEAAFSEILSASSWCRLWDHIITNEPSFLIMCVVAYNILHRQALLVMNSQPEFEIFYHSQNVIDIKRLISKSYVLLRTTSKETHPNRYLNTFAKLEEEAYPIFVGFPKTLIDFDFNEIDNLKLDQANIEKEENELLNVIKNEQDQISQLKKQEEENERLNELENVCRQKINDERERVMEQRNRLLGLRKQLHQEEVMLLNKSRQSIIEKNAKNRQWALEKILNDVQQNRAAEELEVVKAESDMIKRYSELLHHKIYLEEALNAEPESPDPRTEHKLLQKHQQKLNQELERITNESNCKVYAKHLNLETGLAAMDDLILRIEMELAKQTAEKYEDFNSNQSNMMVVRLDAETKQLDYEVSKLLNYLTNIKATETRNKLSELHINLTEKPQKKGQTHYSRQQKLYDAKNKITHVNKLDKDFGKIKKLIQSRRGGYSGRRSSPVVDRESSKELAVINFSSYL